MQKIIRRYRIPIFVAVLFLWVGFTTPFKNSPVIRSDGMGYHAWIHTFLHAKLGSCDLKQLGLLEKLENGNCINKYPPGVAFMRLPLFVFTASSLSFEKINAFEHAITLWMSIVLGYLSFLIFYKLARSQKWNEFSSWVVALIATFGTGVFHYSTYDASFSHIYTVFCMSCLIYFCFVNKSRSIYRWIFIAFITWLAVMIRNTNVFMILTMIGISFLQKHRSPWFLASMLCLGSGLAVLTQIALNSYVHGSFAISSYTNEGFEWNRPMAHYIFVSYERGLLNYYPSVAWITGLLFFHGRSNRVSLLVACMIVFYAVFYGFWHSWMLAGGFGHRGFVDLVPMILWGALGLREILMSHKKFWAIVFGLSVFVTLVFMAGYWNGTFPFFNADERIYWKQFSNSLMWKNFASFITNAHFPTMHQDSLLSP